MSEMSGQQHEPTISEMEGQQISLPYPKWRDSIMSLPWPKERHKISPKAAKMTLGGELAKTILLSLKRECRQTGRDIAGNLPWLREEFVQFGSKLWRKALRKEKQTGGLAKFTLFRKQECISCFINCEKRSEWSNLWSIPGFLPAWLLSLSEYHLFFSAQQRLFFVLCSDPPLIAEQLEHSFKNLLPKCWIVKFYLQNIIMAQNENNKI